MDSTAVSMLGFFMSERLASSLHGCTVSLGEKMFPVTRAEKGVELTVEGSIVS